MRSLRVALLLSPLLLFLSLVTSAGSHPAAWYLRAIFLYTSALRYMGLRGIAYLGILAWTQLVIGTLVIAVLAHYYARATGRDRILWPYAVVCLPLLTPIVLALLPNNQYSASVQWWRGSAASGDSARSVHGSFEDRFPLLARSLAGQQERARSNMKAHFRGVRSNFEFMLPVDPDAADRIAAEARSRGFTVWPGTAGTVALVYGAGLVRPSEVDEINQWLRGAGAPGQKLTAAFRSAEGTLTFTEHYFDKAAGAGA